MTNRAKRAGARRANKRQRAYLPDLAELIDRLTVDQIKLFAFPRKRRSYVQEMRRLERDIDVVLGQKKVRFSARLVRMIALLSQMNLHIWHYKDRMTADPPNYLKILKLCHQLNGLRNQTKNAILRECKDGNASARRTNTSMDGLKGWNISLKI